MLAVSIRTLWRLASEDKLKPIRIGRSVRWRLADIQKFVDQLR
jgi:predicted DNA-binding transcriptional regulator AlpA